MPIRRFSTLRGMAEVVASDKYTVIVGGMREDTLEAFALAHPAALVCVDPFAPRPKGTGPASCGGMDAHDYESLFQTRKRSFPEMAFVRRSSYFGRLEVPDKALGACYLDDNPGSFSTLIDCVLWWDKLKSGGVLCGHDFSGPFGDDVKTAVNHFVRFIGKTEIDFIADCLDADGVEMGPKSWGITKP